MYFKATELKSQGNIAYAQNQIEAPKTEKWQ